MKRGQAPGAPVRKMGKVEPHGASWVQATDTNQQELPISHPDLLPAKIAALVAATAGSGSRLFLVWQYSSHVNPASDVGKNGKSTEEKKRQIALGTNIFSTAPTLWVLLQHGHPFASTQSCWCTPRYPHGPTHVSARASKLQTRDGHKNLFSKRPLTNNPPFKLSCCLILNSITSNMPVAGGPALRA